MLLDLLLPLMVGGTYMVVHMAGNTNRKFEKQIAERAEKQKIIASPVQNSAQCDLILEMFRADEGWDKTRPYAHRGTSDRYTHESGVRVCIQDKLGVTADILDEDGVWQRTGISDAEYKLIAKEVAAYESRAADRKQRELTAALARRIAGGTVPPVLAGPKLLGPPPADEDSDRGSSSVSSGSISFDKQTGKVVASVRGDNVKLSMDASFRNRYLTKDEANDLHPDVEELARSLGMIRPGPLKPQKVMK